MIIYCNGDSFVAGVELGDTIIPDHPGFIDYNDEDPAKYRPWSSKTWDTNTLYGKARITSWNQIEELDRKKSFPSKLNQLLNVPVINRAHGGASLDRIVRTALTDLIELKKTNDNIVAIIGTTDISREEIPTCHDIPYPDSTGDPGYWISVTPHHTKADEAETDGITKYKLLREKDYHGMLRFYKNVILLKDFCKLNNIKLYWISTNYNVKNIEVEKEYETCVDLLNFKEYAEFEYILDMDEIAKTINTGVICPANHFSEIVHDEVAKQLAEILKEDLNV